MPEITPEQQRVLDAQENLVVLGRPGSGKTTVALWKAKQLLESERLKDYQKVLFLSFSRGAVGRIAASARLEMPRELRRRLKIATYHSFCHEVLTSHCALVRLRPPFQVLLPEDARIIKNELAQAAEEELSRLESLDSRVRFDRFVPRTVGLLRKYPVLRQAYGRSYPLILVDEYQDTDDAEDELVRLFATQSQVVCLGDPDQRIYDYRQTGIRPDRLERLETDHRFRRIDLGSRNHRNLTSGIREYARSILAGVPGATRAVHILRTPAGRTQLVRKICEAVTITRAVARREGWGGRRGPAICVMLPTNNLVRTVSRQLHELPEEDRRRFRHEVFVDRAELGIAWDLSLDLLASVSTRQIENGIQAMLSHLSKYFRHRGGSVARQKAARLEEWRQQFASGGRMRSQFIPALRLALEGGPPCTGSAIADMKGLLGVLKGLPGDYLADIVELLELRCPGVSEPKVRNDLTRLFVENGDYGGAAAVGRQYILMETLLDTSERRARLSLMTLHRCKGSEFDAVVLAETSQQPGRFVIREEGYPGADLARSRRLFHVALTRARHRATILTPVFDQSPLLGMTSHRQVERRSRRRRTGGRVGAAGV